MSEENEHDGGGAELIGRERIRGASRAIPEGTAPDQVTADQIAQVAADVEIFRRAHKLTRKDIAAGIGYSESVVSEFLSGKYLGSGCQVAIDLDGWLVDEEAQRAKESQLQFVWTNVALFIKAVAGYALDHRSIGMVYGPETAGMGKTTALQAIYESIGNRRCALVRLDKMDASPTGLLKKILSAIGAESTGGNLNRFNRIVAKLKGRNFILLVDQVHNLRFAKDDKPLYMLADLHDATKTTAQLWTGTSDLVAYLDRQRARTVDESLAQIRSRIFPCVDLIESLGAGSGGTGELLVTVQQVRDIFARNQLRISDRGARFLAKLANTPDAGGLRLCVKLVEYATMLGGMQGLGEIDVPLLLKSLRCCVSSARADLLVKDIESPTVTAVARAG